MSYQVLARKWRPKTFSELMGQEHVVSVLTNAISQQRLHHAYLFTGTRGVGKTTIARIFAKSLNCEQGVSAEPCGKCDACVDIDQGRFVDLLEIDAASRTKVDDTREILDNVQYAPTRGRYKVYLIDEVHMLSRSSFNALLKTLEEPPEHVKFILATTDPQKLPVTVLSRCLQFHLKALTVGQIEQQLEKILHAEHVTFDVGSLTLLSRAARGSMRDSLSLTDQAIAQGQGNITIANLQQMLGGIDQHWPYKILMALVKQDAQGVMALSKEIASYAPNYYRLFAELIQLLHHIALYQIVKQHFDVSPEHSQLIDKFSQVMSAQDIQLYYQLALNGRKDLPYAGDEQSAFDMTLLRLLAFKPMQQAQPVATSDVLPPQAVSFDDVNLSETQVTENQATAPQVIESQTTTKATEIEASSKEAHDVELSSDVTQDVGLVESVEDEAIEDTLSQEVAAIEQTAQQLSATPVEIDKTDEVSLVHADTEQQPELIKDQKPFPETIEETELFSTNNTEAKTSSTQIMPNVAEGVENQLPQQSESNLQTNSVLSAPVESALATRNMLRSRKKKLESDSKKSDDAQSRQTPVASNKPVIEVPTLDTLPEQGFEIEAVDPAVVKKANQVDKWANMIDAMALNGRLRVLAQHAVISKACTDEQLVLELNQSAKHLKTEAAMEQLHTFVSDYFGQQMTVEVIIVEDTQGDPLKIQGQINEKRYDYAKALLAQDSIVQSLQQQFQAELDESTIIAK